MKVYGCRFNSGRTDRTYYYKWDGDDDLNIDDTVITPPRPGMRAAAARIVTPEITAEDGAAYDSANVYLVSKVDMTAHNEREAIRRQTEQMRVDLMVLKQAQLGHYDRDAAAARQEFIDEMRANPSPEMLELQQRIADIEDPDGV